MQARNPPPTRYPPRLEQGTLCLHVGSLPTGPPLLGRLGMAFCFNGSCAYHMKLKVFKYFYFIFFINQKGGGGGWGRPFMTNPPGRDPIGVPPAREC